MPDEAAELKSWVTSELNSIQNKLDQVDTAFTLDDLGKPNYHGHRSDHRQKADLDKAATELKVALVKQFLGWVLILLLGGIAGYYGIQK